MACGLVSGFIQNNDTHVVSLGLVRSRFAKNRFISELWLHHSENASDVRLLANSQVHGACHRDVLDVVLQLVRVWFRVTIHGVVE
jgi:hypothetical protein